MSEIERALANNPIKELIKHYREEANNTMDNEEYERLIATAFYLDAYTKLPFNE